MRGSKTLYHELPLFAGQSSTDPSYVWQCLDDATREQVVQRVVSLLLAHTKPDVCRTASPANPNPGVNAP